MSCNYGAEMKVSCMPKCPAFSYNSGLRLSLLYSMRCKEMPHRFNLWGISLLGMEYVQKCPTGLGVGTSRNTPQVMGGNYRRTAYRSGVCSGIREKNSSSLETDERLLLRGSELLASPVPIDSAA